MYKSGTGTRGRGHRDECVGTWDLGLGTWGRETGDLRTVVPKSYRPKGQPRSTRNELPIRADFGNSRKHPIWRLKRGEN